MNWSRCALAVGLAGLIAYAASVILLFAIVPVPWPDEFLFADVAIHLSEQGSLGSDLFDGAMTGAGERTYWMPPVYFIALGAAFKVAGVSLEVMRALSLAAGITILIGTFVLGRQLGQPRWAAVAAAGLLASDPVFVRASLVGRMDGLALSFVIVTAVLATRAAPSRRRDLTTGAIASVAALVHPVGAIAIPIALARPFAGLASVLRSTAIGIALPALGWAAYIAQDLSAFSSQLAMQLTRKLDRGLVPLEALDIIADQYGSQPWSFIVFWAWALGALGLVLGVRRDRRFIIPLVALVGGTVATLWLIEIWYALHLLPFAACGVVVGLRTLAARRSWSRLAFAGIVAASTIANVDQLVMNVRAAATPAARSYQAWGDDVAEVLPIGARILLATPIPDPSWRLRARADLRLHAIVEAQSIIDHYGRSILDFDYVLGGSSMDPRIVKIIADNTDLRAVIRRGEPESRVSRCRVAWLPCRGLEIRVFEVRRGVGGA